MHGQFQGGASHAAGHTRTQNLVECRGSYHAALAGLAEQIRRRNGHMLESERNARGGYQSQFLHISNDMHTLRLSWYGQQKQTTRSVRSLPADQPDPPAHLTA